MSKPEKECLLFVEGADEENFFGAFLDHLGIENIQIQPVGGRSQLKGGLGTFAKGHGFHTVKRIGVVQDADQNPEEAKAHIAGALEDLGLPAPDDVGEFQHDNPSTGMMVLPGDGEEGMLEDLCLKSVQDGPPLDCVDNYFECVEPHQDELPKNTAKARMQAFLSSRQWCEEKLYDEIQDRLENEVEISDSEPLGNAAMETYLASQSKPRMDLGLAAQNDYWDFEHSAFDDLRAFLEELADV